MITEKLCVPANVGVVRFWFVGSEKKGVVTNVVTNTFKEACARLLAGATDWKPSHIGFVVREKLAEEEVLPTLTAPAATDTLDTVIAELADIGDTEDSNILVTPLATIPEVTPGTATSAIVFNGCTAAFTTDNVLIEGGKSGFNTDDLIYNVLLLADTSTGFKLLARAELTGTPTKTADRELAVYWQITMTTPVPV